MFDLQKSILTKEFDLLRRQFDRRLAFRPIVVGQNEMLGRLVRIADPLHLAIET